MKQQVFVQGFGRSKGTSKKTGKDYDFCKLNVTTKATAFGSESEAYGNTVQELHISPELFEKLKTFKDESFQASIVFEADLGSGRLNVVDVDPV